jgi:hypothetical protein
MVRLLRDVLGLRVEFEEEATMELSLPDGARVQVFRPGDPYFAFFGEHAHGPVALFEVRDVRGAEAELRAAGVEIVGEPGRDQRWEWVHARFPGGNLYELASRRER